MNKEKLYQKFRVPKNILEHMKKVSETAVIIAKKLKEKNVRVNIELVKNAAILHDIDKIQTLNNYKLHGLIAGKELRKHGLKKLALIIERHPLHMVEKLDSIEEKIVFYADKIVTKNKIVELNKRKNYALKRYAKNKEQEKKIKELFEKTKEIEKELFKLLKVKPKEFFKELKNG